MLVSDKGFNCTSDEKRTHEGCGGTPLYLLVQGFSTSFSSCVDCRCVVANLLVSQRAAASSSSTASTNDRHRRRPISAPFGPCRRLLSVCSNSAGSCATLCRFHFLTRLRIVCGSRPKEQLFTIWLSPLTHSPLSTASKT